MHPIKLLGETLNFVSLVMQFYLVDVFLNNKFRWFGMEVVEYYSWSFRDRQNRDLMLRWVKCQNLLLLCLV